ncbi:hypothetical protein FM076_16975 [Streptomyces albus subsp. chlorinus]|uniref:hypothetical protein n=1 Tax=Streptomyces albus TaxID=1888 RepID=UPI00156E8769|nr:hypothetical protein [Streptomyces albus]NSC22769.1 hypothetical protein [Streptomyces albus subsp. chlorinus]
MATVEEMREELQVLLNRSEEWLHTLTGVAGVAVDPAGIDRDVRDLAGKRSRALSTLLNVGLLGRQSSGKSFLISGLQKGLRYVRLPQDDGGYTEKYLGILPSSPLPTTACPSTVTPVEADSSVPSGSRGLLRVRFAETSRDGWVDIGTDLRPGVLAAYGAADGDVTNRDPAHYQLTVEELELLLPDAALPAKFFDLPGAESPNPAYESIMRNAWAEADCFVYVSQGTATLTAHELGLITDLYNHHLQTGKPVLWVLTGIDRANQLGNDNRPAWQSALETNNTYLRERFGDAEAAFIGEGFVPVSPAWEAQAALDESEGSREAAHRNRANSRMDALRERLTRLIENGAGQVHLERIAEETRRLVRRRHRLVADTLATHRVSVEELTTQRSALRRQRDQVDEAAARIERELREDISRRIRTTEQLFGGLAHVFHQELDTVIDNGDLGLEHTSDIRRRQTRLFTEWMNAAQGPATVWQGHLRELDSRARAALHLELGGQDAAAQLVAPEPMDPGDLLNPLDERRPLGLYGMVQAAAATIGVVGPMAGGATWLMSSLSLASLVFPVGAAVAVGLAGSLGAKALKDRKSVIERARDERKGQLDQQAQDARADFVEVAGKQGQLLCDAVATHLAEHRARLRSSLHQLEERIQAPDVASSRALVAQLEPVERAGQELIDALDSLSHQARSAHPAGRAGR